jgi:hypothetical protein
MVVFPLPLSPTMATIVAGSGAILKEKSLRAVVDDLLNRPPP